MKKQCFILFAIVVPGLFTASAQSNKKIAPQSALDFRIDSLLKAMTLAEKLDQVCNNGFMTTPDNKRLDIPGFVMDDGPHGVRFLKGSAFPTGIAMAATWDKHLGYQVGNAMGEEFWASGKHQQLGPCIDISQDPRGGRTAESAGEDTYLSGQMGVAIARGIQSTPVMATVKHFMIEGKQSIRNTRNELFTDRLIMENYGYNFRTVVQEAGIFSVMSSYNLVNGIHSAESGYLLDTVLRKRWGFPFYVVSDWAAVHNSKSAIFAGNDVCMGSDNYRKELPGLIASGQVPVSQVDAAVRNILRSKILAGMLDHYPVADKNLINSPRHQAICLESARESVILLKNQNNILPLNNSKIKTIAVIGPNADKENLNCFGSSETTPVYAVSLLAGIEKKVGRSKILIVKGCDINSNSETGFGEALAIAAKADVVIFAGGLDATQEGEAYDSGHDRTGNATDLPGKQQQLINELSRINKNLVVVIQSGGVCSLHKCITNIKGLIYSFYAGEEAGNALADVIFGDFNPGGRMPLTMPVSDAQLPEWNDDYTDDFGNGYRWFDEKGLKPEFAFGFGLSYGSYRYSDLKISHSKVAAGDPFDVTLNVQNTGKVSGTEVVQLYVSNTNSKIWMPKKELKAFNRVALGAGEKKQVTFKLTAEDLYTWDENQKEYVVQSGEYILKAGGASDNLPLQSRLKILPSSGKPDLTITRLYTMPRYPKQGEKVTFYALVKNQGNAAINQKDTFDIYFNAGSINVAVAKQVSETILPGQIKLISSNINHWAAGKPGRTEVNAVIKAQKFKESVTTNNAIQYEIQVF